MNKENFDNENKIFSENCNSEKFCNSNFDESSLNDLRDNIDNIDTEILVLLNKRAENSLRIRKIKQQNGDALYSPRREEEVIDKLSRQNEGPLFNKNVKEIFKSIMRICRSLPDKE